MSAIFFYLFVYFVGYYGSQILNMFTVRPLVTNRYLAALVPVVTFAVAHAYMIVSKPPPASQDITVESALFNYVVMPVIIVTLGAIYFMWSARPDTDSDEENTLDISETNESIDSTTEEAESTDHSTSEASGKKNKEQSEENNRNDSA